MCIVVLDNESCYTPPFLLTCTELPEPSRPRLKLMVISKGGRKNARPNRDDDDEDYVPELGADSDSDCSGVGGAAEEEVDIQEEEEEVLEDEEEDEEEEEVVEEEGAELTISTVDGSENAFFTTAVLPVSAVSASSSSSAVSTAASETTTFTADNTSSPIFSPTYVYLTDAGSVAFPIPSVPLSNTSAYVTLPTSQGATPTILSVAPGGVAPSPTHMLQSSPSSSENSMALPPEFQNLLLSDEFQR